MGSVKLIAVCGGSGSGKSTIVKLLSEAFTPEEQCVLHMDHYYKDLSHSSPDDRDQNNFDHPDAMDMGHLIADLRKLKAGRSIRRPAYDFVSHTRSMDGELIEPRPYIFVDGILSGYGEELRALLDRLVFVEVDADLRFIRRLTRDVKERGRTVESVIEQYLKTVRPMYETYVKEQAEWATDIINWNEYDKKLVTRLVANLR